MSVAVSRSPSVLAVVGALVMVGCAVLGARALTSRPDVRTLTGVVTWVDTERAQFDRDVHGGLSYPMQRLASASDCLDAMLAVSLAPAQLVTIYDSQDRLVASGNLGEAEAPAPRDESGRDRDCRVSFIVEGVRDAGPLTVEVANQRETFARHELDAVGWNVEIALGP